MNKKNASTDVTYCTNDNCIFKMLCERHKDHYNFDPNYLYWFGEFDDLECGKRRKDEL